MTLKINMTPGDVITLTGLENTLKFPLMSQRLPRNIRLTMLSLSLPSTYIKNSLYPDI